LKVTDYRLGHGTVQCAGYVSVRIF